MGNRITTIGDSLTIKIGIDNDNVKENYNRESNRIKSTKYTLVTFLPQNLLEQFRRIANFYFLIMTIIAIVIDSPVSPLTSLMPLVFVIAVTATKQGYEDYLRHKADNMVNYSLVTVIRNGTELDIRCQDILQGDLVKVPRDCDVPCDLVLLRSSDLHNKCFITTANLDGETNLKTLITPKGLPIVDIDKLHTLGIIECELPRTDLYTFNGRIELSSIFGRREISTDLENLNPDLSNVLPLMAENLLLRGSRVKNTEYAIGCAVYTGQNTKLALNSRLTRNKVSSSETYINKFLVFFLVLLIGMVTISYFLKRYFDLYHSKHNFYLGERVQTYQVSQFLQDYFSFLILYNYIIPISLYVTIEMHKFLGSFFLEWDTHLYDSSINQPCIVNTSDLNEELGQVRLLFSDKTGTLTKNEMIFQQCSINGVLYRQVGSGLIKEGRNYITKIHNFKDDAFTFLEALAVCHTVQVAGDDYDEENHIDRKEKVENTYQFKNINEENDKNINDGDLTILDEIDDSNATGMNIDQIHEIETIKTTDKKKISSMTSITPATTPFPSEMIIVDFQDSNQISVTNNNNNSSTDSNDIIQRNLNNINNNNDNNNEINNSQRILINKHRRPLSLIENSTNTERRVINQFSTSSNINNNNNNNNLNPENNNIDFRHTISHEMANNLSSNLTHRRTQSYAASTTLMRTYRNENNFDNSRSYNRSMNRREVASSLMANTREYYAAPSFTEASLVERKESVLRRTAIKSIIEQLDYQASSPDEKALVEACAKMGMVYTGDDDDILTIKLKTSFYQKNDNKKEIRIDDVDAVMNNWREDNTNEKHFLRLGVLDFTSDRKRMSIIIKDKMEQIWLYTKGAESHVLPLCTNTPDHLIVSTQNHINQFAKQGLRTLAIARRKLSALEFANYNNDLLHANNSLTDRKNLVEQCQRNIETNLELLGATAVEDALQDNVRDTLEALRNAGIKVWVLTGDKVETALNIALSCGHIPESAFKYFITECKTDLELKEHLDVFQHEMLNNTNKIYTLLIDGISLAVALKCCAEKFRDIAIHCRAVLCCRLSPLQKCEVVHLMKTVSDKPITAAIGDGANDVSMIQEAHVGLGIVGKEGRQAARCADYAFANFSMIKRILLVHGHYYSQRMATVVLYFFYKNLVFMMVQFIFQIFSMFSSQSIYDSVFLTLYNVVYTALPILVLSLTDKIYMEDELMEKPKLYTQNAKNKRLSWKYFVGWMILAVYHSFIIFFFAYIIWINNNIILPTMRDVNFYCFGTFLVHNIVVVVNLKLWLEAHYQTYFFIISIWISIFGFMLTTVLYNLFDVNYDGNMLWVYNNLLSSYTFWVLSSIITIATLLPDYTLKICQYLDIHIGHIFPGPIEEKQSIIKHNLQFSRQTSRLTEVLSRQTSRMEEPLSVRPISCIPETTIIRQHSVLSQRNINHLGVTQRPYSYNNEQLATIRQSTSSFNNNNNINNNNNNNNTPSRPVSSVPAPITRQSSRITDSTYL